MKYCIHIKTNSLLLFVFILLINCTTAISQTRQVTGKVISGTTNEPLVGASVEIKGTTTGTITDNAGNFTISASPNATLVIGFVGYTSQEIVVGSQTNITVTLGNSTAAMNEVVVIGYQTVRRRDLTGAASTINAQNTERLAARSLPEQLQGMAAGVSVRTGGQPGQEAVVNIRGLGTFTGNANPLYIIDGMYSDPNTTINPDDVATIQVLKDASAAAIYGSRAANGVIIITTKKGREGPMKVAVSSKYGVSQIPRRYNMMNGPEYVATNKAAFQAAGYPLQPAVANYNDSINTNWADEALRTGVTQDYNVTLSGGSRNATYLISGSYFNDKGTLIARDFQRTALRINTEATRGRFKFGENLMLSSSVRNSPYENNFEVGNPWYDVWNNLPIIPVRSPSLVSSTNPGGLGMGSSNAGTFSRNLVAIADITSAHSTFFKILGNGYIDFKFADWLNYHFNAGAETSFDHTKTVRKDGSWYWNQSPKPSEVGEGRGQFLSYLFEHTLNFNHKFDKHSFNGVLGYTEQTIKTDNSFAGRTGLASYNGQYFTTITSASSVGPLATGGNDQTLISSFLGRLIYNFDDRYLATFTFRSDKDSRFSPNYRTGFFPSAAVAWNISNEKFFHVNAINNLKVRGSYGVLGAANLGNYQFTSFLNQGPRTVFGSGQTVQAGATQARLGSPDLRWEKKKTTNIGVDAQIINRINVTIDVFRALSEDVLVEQPLPRYLGNLGGNPLVNIGSIENKGIELEAGYHNSRTRKFAWGISGNVSFIRNKVLSLGNLGKDPVTGLERNYIQSGNTRSQVGHSIGEYFVLITDGIFQSQKEIDDHKAQVKNAKVGDIRYLNIVDEGTNDDINDKDRQFAGSPWPKFTTGFQLNAAYKNFTLNVQLYGAFGQKLYNDVRRDLDGQGYSNYRRDINPWSPTNTNTNEPRLGVSYAPAGQTVDLGVVSNGRGNTDRWIEDGSYLRMRSLELGYMLPKSLLNRNSVSNARLYVSGQNLFTLTKYKGIDPDVVGANANLEPGVDNGNYPASRILAVGINVGF